MDYIKLVDGQPTPYTEALFRTANANTVYGSVIKNLYLNAQDVYRVRTLDKPSELGKRAVKQSLPTQVDGEWVLNWDLVVLDEVEARVLRDTLLAATDWTANSDVTMTAEMTTYRQALRDITDQSGFPENITWPQEPST
jgi:hypothetical protein